MFTIPSSTASPGPSLGHTPGPLAVDDLAQLGALPATMRELAAQAREIVAYAGTWVCDTDGFQPSPLCVLRPLVPVLRRLEEAFDDLGRELVEECERLALGLEDSRAELVGADAAAAVGLGPTRHALDALDASAHPGEAA